MTQSAAAAATNLSRIIEFLLLFICLPAILAAYNPGIPVLLYLWLLTLLCLLGLWEDPTFDRRQLWNSVGLWRNLRAAALHFAIAGPALAIVAWLAIPGSWHASPLLRHPGFWFILVLAYPVLSVYPQGIVFRSFILHRYRNLIPGEWPIVLVSAFAFAFVHIVFNNWVAPALAFAGGLLFARTYQRTRSLLAASLEHALYGCWVFTIGLGHFFYSGTAHLLRSMAH